MNREGSFKSIKMVSEILSFKSCHNFSLLNLFDSRYLLSYKQNYLQTTLCIPAGICKSFCLYALRQLWLLMLLSTYLNILVIYWGVRLFKLLKTITVVLRYILLCRSIHHNLASRIRLLLSGSLMALPLTSRMVHATLATCFCVSTRLWTWGELPHTVEQ